jgi:hypothetical protein
VPLGTQFLKILFSQKIPNKIVGVKGGISFDSQEIFNGSRVKCKKGKM